MPPSTSTSALSYSKHTVSHFPFFCNISMQSIESLKEGGVKVLRGRGGGAAVEFLGLSFELRPWDSDREREGEDNLELKVAAAAMLLLLLGRNLHIHDFFPRLFPRWRRRVSEGSPSFKFSKFLLFLFPLKFGRHFQTVPR